MRADTEGGFKVNISMAKEQWESYFDAVKKEDWKTAKNILQSISKQEKNNPQTFMKIGDVCQRTGDKTESIAAYTHAAQLLRMQGFAQKALATYKIALRLDPNNPEIIRRAEILMDEFETAKTAPHMPAPTLSPAPVTEEPPLTPQETAPADIEPPQTSDWLERTAVTPEASAEKTIVAEILSSEMNSILESTSLTSERPLHAEEPTYPAVDSSPTIAENVPASENTQPYAQTFDSAVAEPEQQVQAMHEVISPAMAESVPSSEPASENEQWLESAYEALDTKMFKPETERPSEAAASRDNDAINLIFGQRPAEPDEELAEAMKQLITPLSERMERSVPEIFQDLPEQMVASFMNDLAVMKFRDKQHVIEEGDSGDSMYIIRTGRTRVVAHMLGRELELAVLGEGDVFGEVGFLTGRPRTAAVIADGPVEVYEISRLDIEKLIEANPEIIARIEDFYETRVRDTIRKIKN
ncbi:MAG: cyclic nucleotide-binding domain-containing protein [Nitrospirae bacterium]|nr:cyclic nucleotide-binding domain-containing protein [Nitrospirota bacterium]